MHSPCWSTATHTAPGSAAHSACVIRLPRRSSAPEKGSVSNLDAVVGALDCACAASGASPSTNSAHTNAPAKWRMGPSALETTNFNRKFREATPSASGQPGFLSAGASGAYPFSHATGRRLIRRREQRSHVLGRHLARHGDRHRRDFLRYEIGLGAIEAALAQPLRDRKAAQQGGQAIRTIAAERGRE